MEYAQSGGVINIKEQLQIGLITRSLGVWMKEQ